MIDSQQARRWPIHSQCQEEWMNSGTDYLNQTSGKATGNIPGRMLLT